MTDLRPPPRAWVFLAGGIVSEVAGSLSLKAALDRPWFYLVVAVGFTVALALVLQALRAGIGIGVAYGIWGAVGVALTAVLSMVIFGEPLTPVMIAGIALIIAGVLCIELGSRVGQRGET